MNRRQFLKQSALAGGFLWVGNLWLPKAQVVHGPVAAGGNVAACATKRDEHSEALISNIDNRSYRYLAGKFTAAYSYTLCSLKVNLNNTNSPTGTAYAYIYSNNSDSPGTQQGTGSTGVNVNTFTSDALDTFSNMSVDITIGYVYWVVIDTGTGSDGTHYVKLSVGNVVTEATKKSTDLSTWVLTGVSRRLAVFETYA